MIARLVARCQRWLARRLLRKEAVRLVRLAHWCFTDGQDVAASLGMTKDEMWTRGLQSWRLAKEMLAEMERMR